MAAVRGERAPVKLLAGLRGEADEAEAIVAEVERAMVPMRAKAVLSDVQLARGTTALGAGRHVDAYNHLIRMFDPNDPAEHYRKKVWAIGDIAKAALHSERREEGRAMLAQAEASAGVGLWFEILGGAFAVLAGLLRVIRPDD